MLITSLFYLFNNMKEFHPTHGKQGARQITLDNSKNKLSAHLSPSSKI